MIKPKLTNVEAALWMAWVYVGVLDVVQLIVLLLGR